MSAPTKKAAAIVRAKNMKIISDLLDVVPAYGQV
jgi:hypothetical protein